MRLRILYIVAIWSMTLVKVSSQTEVTPFYHWSFGVSSGDLLHTLFNSTEGEEFYPAFMLEYTGRAFAVQGGFRLGYNQTHTSYDGFLDSEITESSMLSGQLAGTYYLFRETRWQIKAGLQVVGGRSREDIIEDSGFDRVTTRRLEWNAGLGPVIDFRFLVHPRISLGMEASMIYAWNHSELQQLFTNFPDFDNTKEVVDGEDLVVYEPATIYLRFHF